jgi:hypothetical protein
MVTEWQPSNARLTDSNDFLVQTVLMYESGSWVVNYDWTELLVSELSNDNVPQFDLGDCCVTRNS